MVIPTEPVTEIRNGKKYTVERMFYPGYVLVQMDLTGFRTGGEGDHVWHVVKSTPRVTGFVGTANDPTPLSEDEVNQIIYRVSAAKDKPKIKVKFEKNETVRITDGPFANFNGQVDEVNEDRETSESDGHDLWTLHSGRIGIWSGRESRATIAGVWATTEIQEK